MRMTFLNTFATVCVCALGTVFIAFLWHLMAAPPSRIQTEYVTQFLRAGTPLRWQSAIAFFIWSAAIGAFTMTRRRWIAIGFVSPYVAATLFEGMIIKQAHSLIPMEIILFWAPLGLLTAVGAWVGRLFVPRMRSSAAMV